MKTLIAKWESQRRAHWVELYRDEYGYSYIGNGCGGSLGSFPSDETALAYMRLRVKSGYFLPDAAKTPMKQTI
jgi:hypothetical protein